MKNLFLISLCLAILFTQIKATLFETANNFLFGSKSKDLFERGSGFWSNTQDEYKKHFFNKLTDPENQREDWYKVTPYIAEFWCTISNAGFIYVGMKEKSSELLFAGFASIVSHTIPKKWLNFVDKFGVVLVLLKGLKEYKIFLNNPKLILIPCMIAIVNRTDVYFARNKGIHWSHVIWHLSSAFFAKLLLDEIKKIN